MRMTNKDLAAVVNRELEQARGYASDFLATRRATALDLYNGRIAAAPDGRSQAVSNDVADSIHATLAQIGPVVRSSQIEFEAQSQEDEQQAQTESDFVRVSIDRASGYDVIDNATFDALLEGNGWLHAYVDESTEVTEQTFPAELSDEEVYALTSMAPAGVKVTLKAGKDKTVAKVERTRKRLVIECVPPENMFFAESGQDYNLDQLRFVARKRLYTAAALKSKGIPDSKIAKLPDAMEDYPGDTARQGGLAQDGTLESVQDANRLKVVYCCYIRFSSADNNSTELRHVWIGDNQDETLIDEPAEFIPFVTGSAVPMPHRIAGTGLAELLRDLMLQKSHVLRQYMDNLAVLNGSRIGAVEGQVNMADLTNGRINGVVRIRSPNSIVPIPAADIGPQAITALGYLDSVRTQRVGASLDFSEVQAQLMGTSATAAAGQLSKVEMMGGWFAGNIARTLLLPLFTLVHRILRTELAGPVMARIGGKWQQADTSQWQPRLVTDIQMGLTTTEKAERILALNQTIQMMQGMMASGGSGIITDLPRLYNAMGDWIRTAGLGSPDQYLIDPKSPESQQASQQKADDARKAANEKMQVDAAIVRLEKSFELEKQKRDLEFKRWAEELRAEVEEAKLVTNGVLERKKLRVDQKEKAEADDAD
jgi:hypothetical protein